MVRIYIISLLLALALSAPSAEKMSTIPGYPLDFNTSIYSGYLDLQNNNRSAHYLFVESINGANNREPLTLWLNGGPGCSSLLGFIQQIGPFYIEQGINYKQGDNLTQNPNSWHKVSNLLFLQSPAGVGFSYNLDTKFEYNDIQTANDNFKALLSFYTKFPEYRGRGLWLAGQSYAGKYIPDLAVLIDQYNNNRTDIINFKGIFVGNGIMSFSELSTSQVQFMVGRSFIDPQLLSYWRSSCQTDPDSAGCRYFQIKFQQNIDEINPYNVYSYCYYNDSFDANKTKKFESQHGILNSLKKQYREKLFELGGDKQKIEQLVYKGRSTEFTQEELSSLKQSPKFNGAPCAYFDGMYNYFTINAKAYNAKFPDMKWNGPCAQNITYHIDPRGSMESYRYLLGRFSKKYSLNLYNGNWDVVVPYVDTVKNIKALNLRESYIYSPWFTNDQHSGFSQLYSGLLFTIVKGASHQVPQTKRPQALNLFNLTLQGHPELMAKAAAYKHQMEIQLQ